MTLPRPNKSIYGLPFRLILPSPFLSILWISSTTLSICLRRTLLNSEAVMYPLPSVSISLKSLAALLPYTTKSVSFYRLISGQLLGILRIAEFCHLAYIHCIPQEMLFENRKKCWYFCIKKSVLPWLLFRVCSRLIPMLCALHITMPCIFEIVVHPAVFRKKCAGVQKRVSKFLNSSYKKQASVEARLSPLGPKPMSACTLQFQNANYT